MITYDEAMCITAGQLRAVGITVPEKIPDYAWVPRRSVKLTVPFRWVERDVRMVYVEEKS